MTSPAAAGPRDSTSSGFTPTLPMCGYVSVTIWPAYEGSVRISWYPVIAVLNTTSPTAWPIAPIARP